MNSTTDIPNTLFNRPNPYQECENKLDTLY